jgi:hypothetical protein
MLDSSGMIHPAEANSAVQITSMAITSYVELPACRLAVSCASWPFSASGSSTRLTFWSGYALFHGLMSLVKTGASSLPTANVIGPIPSADGGVPPDGELSGPQPVSARPAATAAVAAARIARLMLITTSPPLGSSHYWDTFMLCTDVM